MAEIDLGFAGTLVGSAEFAKVYLDVKGAGKVKLVAQGKVGGAVRCIESVDVELVGKQVQIQAAGYTPG